MPSRLAPKRRKKRQSKSKRAPELAEARVRRIHAVVARVPRGRVATYGQVAALAKLPRHARLVGRALRTLPAGSGVPWHRIVNAQGRVSARGDLLGHEDLQEQLLLREGVRLDGGVIALDRFQWRPRS